jgi:serine/threonine protein kinase
MPPTDPGSSVLHLSWGQSTSSAALATCPVTARGERRESSSLRSGPARSLQSVLDPRAGSEPIPGYCLVRLLGKGGFGTVWEAQAPGAIPVALKLIPFDSLRADTELRALEIIRNVRHPHLLDTHFAVCRDDLLVLAMPLCDHSLADRLRECREQGRQGLPLEELLRYMGELAEAIDYLNEPRHGLGDGRLGGIQHRDIKPSNVLLAGGSVRLADFGLAKILEASVEPHSGGMSPHYVAPEELHGFVSRQSDQYALGVTYCQLRADRLPFAGSIAQVLDGHLHGVPDLMYLSEAERQVVARAMAKRPEDRWPSCREFVLQLQRTLAVEPGPQHSPAFLLRWGAAQRLRPRRLGLVAMSLGIASLTALLCASVSPRPAFTETGRVLGHRSVPRRHGHGFPARHLPTLPRGSQSNRRARCQVRESRPPSLIAYSDKSLGDTSASPPRFVPRIPRSCAAAPAMDRITARVALRRLLGRLSCGGSTTRRWLAIARS